MPKDKRIKAEYDRLFGLYADLPSNKLELVEPMIQNVAFIKVTLDDMQKKVAESGATDEYRNGNNQFGKKISADIQAYNQTMKVYISAIDRLAKMLPVKKEKSKLEAFVNE